MTLKPASALAKDIRSASGNLQHRHFATIAGILRAAPLEISEHTKLCVHFADELAQTNPKFDRKRFLAACDVVES